MFVKENPYNKEITGIIAYFGFFLLLNTMIPISLIISLEAVKLFQSAWIEFDEEMYYVEEK